MPVLVGTSGWHYRHWRGGLYPPSMPTGEWLAHYAARFATVELNNAFYRLPERTTFESWRAQVPGDFIFAVKASRYLTHVKRLRDAAEPVRRLMDRAEGLGPKLGPVLLQLPPTLRADPDTLDAALRLFPAAIRVAVEVRHPSWDTAVVRRVLERRRAALCLADADGPRTPDWRTAGWGYVRLHHGRARPDSCYGRSALVRWATWIAERWAPDEDVFVYLNNDGHGCAPRNATQLAAQLEHAGVPVTRVPPVRTMPLT